MQLNVDTSVLAMPAAARLWYRDLIERLAGPELAELAEIPEDHEMASRETLFTGTPGTAWGSIRMGRSRDGGYPAFTERVPSRDGLAWLHDEVTEVPWSLSLTIGHFGDEGQPKDDFLTCEMKTEQRSPGWLMLSARLLPADPFDDPAVQRRWLDALYAVADRVNPGFGQLTWEYSEGRTALELCSRGRDFPLSAKQMRTAMGWNRRQLRGYSWLTIAAQEVADRLGGAEALHRTGAFAEVRQLATGGVWLLATEDFRQYDMAAAEAVFDVVAPVLRPGLPKPRGPEWNDPPITLVFEDPAARAAGR